MPVFEIQPQIPSHRPQARRIARYGFVGGCATAVHYLVLIFFSKVAGVPPAFAAFIGAVTGFMIAYVGNRMFTFQTPNLHCVVLPRYAMIAMLSAIGNGGIVWVGVHLLATHYLVAQLVATVFFLCITYPINRNWSFK